MGLIKAALSSVGGVLSDQWKEYFCCDALPVNILAARGHKKTSRNSSNKKGSDNIISNGSVISVADGQCMIILEQGRVSELCAVPGEFVYDSSSEPSIFTGDLGESVLKSIETIGRRFSFGGDAARDQRVYYFNTKEITENKFGTLNPVPFRVVDKNVGLDVDITVRCNGQYSYKIIDPLLFYTNVCGNVNDVYDRTNIDSTLKTELLSALQPAFAKISEKGIRYSALPGHTAELTEALSEVLSKSWSEKRGIQIVSVGINSITAPKEDEELIKNAQRTAMYKDPTMAVATLVGAQSDAMRSAAQNKNGAMNGFMGINMASQAGGFDANTLFSMGEKSKNNNDRHEITKENTASWKCSCGEINTGKFCTECGAAKPNQKGWSCPSCHTLNSGKFCTECGSAKPAGEPLFACDKCGWQPEDPKNPPKFCPECGDIFDENDTVTK